MTRASSPTLRASPTRRARVDAPVVALWSAGGPKRARWSLRAEPTSAFRVDHGAPGQVRSSWFGRPETPVRFGNDPVEDLRRVLDSARASGRAPAGGWAGWFSYDLGRVLEPAAGLPRPARDDGGWPLIELMRCGDQGARPIGHGAGGFTLDPPRSLTGRVRFERDVARVIEYIRAGDVFQANLSHRLSGTFAGSTRALARRLAAAARPWHGAYLELPDDTEGVPRRRAIVSMSPELFLEFDARTRRVVTRPMKGTRPGSADPAELDRAPKDRAELNMIIDLMRNDLGRVCRFGSVRVADARTIEPHGRGPRRDGAAPSVWQAVATVTGELREGLDVVDLLTATFPPGSVTGAPKIRAMQIIDELEPVARGPYCGCIGRITDEGSATFSVAIRTALVSGRPGENRDEIDGTLDYSVGAGIVADSDPAAEWRETMDKAGTFSRLPAHRVSEGTTARAG